MVLLAMEVRVTDPGELEVDDEPMEVAHEFEVDLNCVIVVNHRLTLEAITKTEDEELTGMQEDFALDDPNILNSIISGRMGFYEELRAASRSLAWVGVVTRFHHWITRFVRKLPATKQRYVQQSLVKELEILNKTCGQGPVEMQFFKDLVNVRDSVIHGDSRAEWEFPAKHIRRVADRYEHPGLGDLELSEEQFNEAIAATVRQVRWYDEKLCGLGKAIP